MQWLGKFLLLIFPFTFEDVKIWTSIPSRMFIHESDSIIIDGGYFADNRVVALELHQVEKVVVRKRIYLCFFSSYYLFPAMYLPFDYLFLFIHLPLLGNNFFPDSVQFDQS